MESKKLNILYVGGFELPDKNAAAQRVIANGKLLRSLGHEVRFLGVNKSEKNIKLENSYLKYYDFDSWSISYPKSLRDWVKYVTKIDKIKHLIETSNFNPDIIITYNFPALSTAKLIKYCRKNNIKLIADITEWYGHKIKSSLGFIKFIDSELRMRYYNKKLDGLICISRYLYDYYKDSVNNVILLPPLVDLTDEKWNVETLPKRDKRIIVYAGSPGGKDKINKLIDSFLKIENISDKLKFRIIGISENDFFSRYNYFSEDEIKVIKAFSVFLGRIPHKDVIKEVTNADFSAFLRENNKTNNAGFPTKFVESISCGTPVLTNRTSNIEDYLTEGKNGYFIEFKDIDKINMILNLQNKAVVKLKNACKLSKKFDFSQFSEILKRVI